MWDTFMCTLLEATCGIGSATEESGAGASKCLLYTFGIIGSKPLACLGHVAFWGLEVIGAIFGSVGVGMPMPSVIVVSIDGLNPGGIERKDFHWVVEAYDGRNAGNIIGAEGYGSSALFIGSCLWCVFISRKQWIAPQAWAWLIAPTS